MKLVKFRIRNYRSIIDSGECYFADDITILAGKNEAGKTVILEALEDLNLNKQIRVESIPLYTSPDLKPHITLWILLEDYELKKMKDEFPVDFNDPNVIIEYNKKYPNNISFAKSNFKNIVIKNDMYIFSKAKFSKDLEKIIEIDNEFNIDDELYDDPYEFISYLNKFQVKPILSEGEQNNIKNLINELKLSVNQCIQFENKINDYIKDNFLPNFILFITFEDIFPNKLPISSAKSNPLINDLTIISDFEIEKFQPNADPSKREMHKREINLKISEDYKKFWNQDDSILTVGYDSNDFYFWIEENGILFPPNLRSKGKQWHLAFYIRVTARSLEEKNNIILIDEPGLFLHAKAQKDILKKLEDCAQRRQLIYTTHSPYLIQPNRLNRLRLIMKYRNKGTKIEKLHASADNETLTPIITAIGEDLMSGLKVDRKNNIILEGISDWYIVNALAELLTNKKELFFIPAVGASKEVYIGAILFGWGVDPIFILDNDSAGDDASKKVEEGLSIPLERIIRVPFQSRGTIEDLFSLNDANKYINKDADKKGKMLRSKQFFEDVVAGKINKEDLSEESINNFVNLFQKIKDLLKSSFDLI